MFQKTQIQIAQMFNSPKAIFVLRAVIFALLIGASLLFPESALADGPSPGGFGGGTAQSVTSLFLGI